jgi:hypothetical protein
VANTPIRHELGHITVEKKPVLHIDPKTLRTECTELETELGQLENEGSNTVYEYHNCIQSYKDAMQAGKHYDPEIDTKDATGLITRPRTRSTKRSPR